MERVIQTRQLYTLRPPEGTDEGGVCVGLCRHLAAATGSVRQADGEGFFAA